MMYQDTVPRWGKYFKGRGEQKWGLVYFASLLLAMTSHAFRVRAAIGIRLDSTVLGSGAKQTLPQKCTDTT